MRRPRLALLSLTLLLVPPGCGGGGGDPGTPADGGGVPDATPPPDGPPDVHHPDVVHNVDPGDDWAAASDAAMKALAGMYDPLTGVFNSGYMWTWASGIEASLTGYERSSGAIDQYMFPATRDLRGFADFLEEFGYDDQAWWGDAWVRAYDVTGNRDYLDLSKRIFADMTAAWDESSCGGGVWWNPNKDFKNAVTAELFILLAANLHNRTPGDTDYLARAKKAWDWFMGIGMVNDQKLINDGLRDCMNRGEPVWTYNQGIILGAAVELYRATGDAAYLATAESLADASTTLLVDANGVFRERCEATGDCNDDQSAFKGIYLRYLMALYDVTGKPAYGEFILRHARSLWASRNSANQFGLSWNGPIDRVDSQRQIAAANALLALAAPSTDAAPFARAAGGNRFNHAMGHAVEPAAWACDAGSCPDVGLVQTGPYLASLRPGRHTLHLLLSGSAASRASTPLVELQVYSAGADAVVAYRTVAWNELAAAGQRADLTLPFVFDPAKGALEFRVRWLAAPGAPTVTLHDVSVGDAPSLAAATFAHACGHLDALERWTTDPVHDAAECAMLSGGALAVAAGAHVARFELQVDDFFRDDAPVARLVVVDHADQHPLASRTLTRSAFHDVLLHGFDVPFDAPASGAVDLVVTRLAAAPTLRARAVQVRVKTQATPVALPYNVRGTRKTAGAGELDDDHDALAAQAFDAPYYAGTHTFTLGPLTDGSQNVVATSGQVVNLPATTQAGAIELLVLSVYGPQPGAFRVDYADGSSQTFTESVGDWWATGLEADEDIGVAAPYFWRMAGKRYGNFHVFLHRLALDPARTPTKLTLPQNPKIKLLAATLVGR